MTSGRERIFELLETADNFVKYAPPGREERASGRARKRYQRALEVAERAGDREMVDQARLRLDDLDRRASLPPGVPEESDAEPGGSILTAELPDHAQARVPPGQRVTRGWPVLHEGPIPRFDRDSWRVKVGGLVERPFEIGYDELLALTNIEMRADFHCVTGWSKLDNVWLGVRAAELVQRAGRATRPRTCRSAPDTATPRTFPLRR